MAPSVLQDGSASGMSGIGPTGNAEKKLRKRRELDAVVAKANKQRNGSGTAKLYSSQELLVDYQNADGGGDDVHVSVDDDRLHSTENLKLDISSPTRALDDAYEEESSDFGYSNDTTPARGKLKRRRHVLHPRRLKRSGGVAQRHKPSVCCQMCGGLWLVTTLVGMCFMVVFAVLGLHVQMKVQVDTFRTELDQVVEERDDIKSKFHNLRSQMQELVTNQTIMQSNSSLVLQSLSQLSSQVSSLNSTVSDMLTSLKSAPELLDLPAQVDEVKTHVAEFGARLKDLQDRVEKLVQENSSRAKTKNTKGPAEVDDSDLAFLVNNSRVLRRDVDALDKRMTNVSAAITEQLQKGETRAAKSWEMIASLQNNYQGMNGKMTRLEERYSKLEDATEMDNEANNKTENVL